MEATTSDVLLYEAEKVIYTLGYGDRFENFIEAQEWVDSILDSRFFKENFPAASKKDIRVCRSQRYEWAGAKLDTNKIMIPIWHLNTLMLIHELTHFTAVREANTESHGPQFCGALIKLVTRFIDKKAGRSLRLSMQAHGIDYVS